MNDSLKVYLEADLNELFRDHVYSSVKEERREDYLHKLMTLGFQCNANPMPCAEFIKWIGDPDYAQGDLVRGEIIYVCNHVEYDGWVYLFDVDGGKVTGFGTNGFNVKFCASKDGFPCYIHEVADKYPESKIAKALEK